MNYAKIYQTLINKAKQRTIEGYSESHHVVPKCMGGTDEPGNLVRLTPEEHFVAHLLLVKMYPSEQRLVYAANMMTVGSSNIKRSNNKSAGWLRRELARNLRNMMSEPERKRQYSERMKKDNPMNRSGVAKRVAEIRRERGNLGRGKLPEHEVKAISERMKANNPCAGMPPWRSPKATPQSLGAWRDADAYYQWWVVNKKGYCAMATAFGFKDWLSAHDNMVRRFKSGWIPTEDLDWQSWSITC